MLLGCYAAWGPVYVDFPYTHDTAGMAGMVPAEQRPTKPRAGYVMAPRLTPSGRRTPRPAGDHRDALSQARRWFEAHGWEYLGQGGSRIVYASPNQRVVAKLPRDTRWGYQSNGVEEYACRLGKVHAYSKHGQTPKTYGLRWLFGMPILFMERVTPIHPEEACKYNWAYENMDHIQVGQTRDGRLVHYDLGEAYGCNAAKRPHALWGVL